MEKKAKHRGTNGGEAFKRKARDFALSVRFFVELALITEGSFSGAARELNRKRIKTMKGMEWHPATVSRAIKLYEKISNEKAEDAED